MKRTVLTFAVLLLLTAGAAAARETVAAGQPEDGAAVSTPFQPAFEASPQEADPGEEAQEPLFVDDGDLLCLSTGGTTCSLSYSCSTQVACASTGTPVRVRHCRCCTCGPFGCDPSSCTTTSLPVGCC